MASFPREQAWYVLRGYRYQLLQSLDAWIGLRPGEVLWLETDEDFSVVSAESQVDTQVKSSAAAAGATPFSLRSSGVKAALSRYWSRSNQGQDDRSYLAFIANGRAACEQGLTFPGDVPGLEYWSVVANEGDTLALRTALASVFQNEPIGQWISSNPSDDELRARLLRRVRWLLRSLDEVSLSEFIRDKLAELYLEKGLLVTLADEALHSLLDRILETASQPNANDRRLTAIDLHRSLEHAAGPTLALQGTIRATAGQLGADGGSLFINSVALPSARTVDRTSTVEAILERTGSEPLLWLHGTHGVGKSTLARLIAARIGGAWLSLDLRSIQTDGKAALSAWRGLVRAMLRVPNLRGVIVDDLAGVALEALAGRIAGFCRAMAPRKVGLIVTSSHEPSAARLIQFEASPAATLQAPYFTEDEVRAFVTTDGGPPAESVEGWTQLIFVTTNGGHPLLVAAKVASLRVRGWPANALLEDIGPSVSDAVKTTREEARRRLLDEIPSSEARQLLRRIGCVFDRTDNALAVRLAAVDPPIPHPTDELAVLRGSWIEILPSNDLRLSPLIADIGHDVSQDDKRKLQRTASEYWLGTGALDQRTLPLCFWNAFWGKHTWILANLCQVIETLPQELLRGVAALLAPMSWLRTDQPIYPESPEVGSMLRLLQFEVANATENSEIASNVALRLIAEIEELSLAEFRLLQKSVAIPKILFAENSGTEPGVQLGLVLQLRATLQELAASANPDLATPLAAITTGLPGGVDLPGFLFAVVVNRIRSSAGMLAMIEALNSIDEFDRNGLVAAAADALDAGQGHFVHNGWAQEQLDDKDLHPVLKRFESMSEIAANWNNADVRAELACAQSVILDEGLDDKAMAVTVVDDAAAAMGLLPALVRQKAKVLGHRGEDEAAARLLMSVEDAVGLGSPLDRTLALRDGGVSAARAGLFSDAIRLFQKAHAILVNEEHYLALAVSVQIEIALAKWSMEDRAGALVSSADVLDALEALDPAGSRQNERAHQFGRALVGHFREKLDPYPDPSRAIRFGQASALAGDEALLGLDLKPLSANWRILAICEIEIGADLGIERRSIAKQAGPPLSSVELFIAQARYQRAILDGDTIAVFRRGAIAASAFDLARKSPTMNKLSQANDAQQLQGGAIGELINDGLASFLESIPLDLMIWYRLREDWNPNLATELRTACAEAWTDSDVVSNIFGAALGDEIPKYPTASIALTRLLVSPPELRGSPRQRFERDLLLVHQTSFSSARRILEPYVVAEVLEGWSIVLKNETFLLRAPIQYGAMIGAAIEGAKTTGLKGAARLLLAAAPAVRVLLTPRWVEILESIGGLSSQASSTPDRAPANIAIS